MAEKKSRRKIFIWLGILSAIALALGLGLGLGLNSDDGQDDTPEDEYDESSPLIVKDAILISHFLKGAKLMRPKFGPRNEGQN